MSEHSHYIPTEALLERSFEALKDQALIAAYKPQFLGSGNEQVVFDFPDHSNVVAKVPVHIIRDIFEGKCDLDAEIREDREINAALKRHFGKHALREYVGKKEIPLTDDLRKVLLRGIKYEPQDSVETLVRIQERVPDEAMQSGYQDGAMWISVRRMLQSADDPIPDLARFLFGGKGTIDEQDQGRMIHARGKEVIEKIKEDVQFKNIVADFVQRAIAYTKDTGRLLDTAGPNNVVYFQKDGEWDYLLVDAKFSGTTTVKQVRDWLSALAEGKDIPKENSRTIINMLAYVSTINTYAYFCGIDDRLQVLRDSIDDESITRIFEEK